MRRWIVRHRILSTILALVLAALLAAALVLLTLPTVHALDSGWPERTAYMERRAAEAAERSESFRLDFRPVPLSQIPETVQRAVLVSEDAGFYGHEGIDWHELGEAIREAWEERESPRGASTISQQLARNLYLSPDRSLFRKLREALISRRLERSLSKNRILELYLNVIEFGPGVFGVEAASRHYFGTGVTRIDRRRAAQLAATIPSPLRHNPATETRTFRWRTDLIYQRAFGDRPAEPPPVDPVPDPLEP